MVRIGLVLVAVALVALVIVGVGLGMGLVQIDSHHISLVHKDSSVDSSTTDQPRIVSADDLLRQKGVSFTEPAPAVEAPKPTPTPSIQTVVVAPVTPKTIAAPVAPKVIVAPVVPKTAIASTPVLVKPVTPTVTPPATAQPVVAGSHEIGTRRPDRGIIRVAAGSSQPMTDPAGNVWEAASGFEGGKIKSGEQLPIEHSQFPSLYDGAWWNATAWHRAVPNGDYTVRLYFAETAKAVSSPGVRVFNVDVQDQHLGDIDIVKEAGGPSRELIRVVGVAVTDGTLTIRFTKPGEHFPIISGIEVIPGRWLADRTALREEQRRDGVIRVDAGSATLVRDPHGHVWQADVGFEGGEIVDRGAIAIANTDFPDIYRTEHYNMTAWNRRMPNGTYLVNLHFAETCDHINDAHPRIFHVIVQGSELRDLNVAKEAGGVCRALVKTFHVAVTNGTLSVLFQPTGNDAPEINGIEVIPEDLHAIRIDAGSAAAVRDPRGNTWEADSGFEGGQTIDRGAIAIANTDFPDLYRTEHYDMTAWHKRVDNGKYTVNLHFAETWDGITDTHARIFHVNVQGEDLRDLNVAKETGGHSRALVKTFHVNVTNGELKIVFQPSGVNVPEINGIEVIRERG